MKKIRRRKNIIEQGLYSRELMRKESEIEKLKKENKKLKSIMENMKDNKNGFLITCDYCSEYALKSSHNARFCSDDCRYKHHQKPKKK